MTEKRGKVSDDVTSVPPADHPRDHISWNQLSMWLRCGMQYYWRYVMGRKERPRLPMVMGKSGHFAIEQNALYKIANHDDQTPEQIIDTFVTDFDKQLAEFERTDFTAGDDAAKTKDLTVETLRQYRGEVAKTITPEAVELEFTMPLPKEHEAEEETPPVNGKIDQIVRMARIVTPRARPVERTATIDYKFHARLPSNMQAAADMSSQLGIYDMSLVNAGKPPEDAGYIHMVHPTKTLPARILPVFRNHLLMLPKKREAWHARTLYKLRTATKAIRNGIFIPTDDPRVCNSCGFQDICQNSLVKKDYLTLQTRYRSR